MATLYRDGDPLCEVSDLRYRHGRHSIGYAPDLCGRLNVVLGEKSPDRVRFRTAQPLQLPGMIELRFDSGSILKLRILEHAGEQVSAEVTETVPS